MAKYNTKNKEELLFKPFQKIRTKKGKVKFLEDLLKERVIGLVKKDDVSMDKLSQMIQGIIKT